MLRVPHGHDYANMISQFDNEALESYWMLYILHSPPDLSRLPLFNERPHMLYSLCVTWLLILELLRFGLWACRLVVVRVCLTRLLWILTLYSLWFMRGCYCRWSPHFWIPSTLILNLAANWLTIPITMFSCSADSGNNPGEL